MLLVLAAISSLASYLVIQNRQKSVKNDFTYLGSGKKGEVFFFFYGKSPRSAAAAAAAGEK